MKSLDGLHFLSALRHHIDLFWPIWIGITALGVTLVLRVIPKQKDHPRKSIRRGNWSRSSIFAVSFLTLFVAFYIAGELAGDDFTYYDNSLLTMGPLAGHNLPIFIWPSEGRFFPLAFQEYNLLRHITNSVMGYHVLRVVQIVLLSLVLLFLDEDLSLKNRVILILLILITPSILISFSGLIYTESNLVFSFVCFALCIQRFEQTHSRTWAVCALISVQFMLYYKEAAFLIILGFACGRMLLRCRSAMQGWDWKHLKDPESRLDACVAFMVVPFLLYYFAAMFPNYRMQYAKDFRIPYQEMLWTYVKIDLLAWVLVAFVLARAYLIFRRDVRPSLLWDGLALGAVAYMASYLAIGMQSAYYFAPTDLIAVLYIGRFTILAWKHLNLGIKSLAVVLLAVILVQDVSLSAFRMYEMKNIVHAKAEVGSVIEEHFQSFPQSVKRIFFPFTPNVRMMELGAYLSYRGVPMERSSGGVSSGTVMMVGKAVKKDGPCVNGKPLVCHSGVAPEPGDFLVVLPDDFAQTGELNSYRQPGTELIFSYNPYPSIPDSLRPIVNPLRVISPEFFDRPLPDSFLHTSVSIWK